MQKRPLLYPPPPPGSWTNNWSIRTSLAELTREIQSSGSQSEHRIRFILPAAWLCHIWANLVPRVFRLFGQRGNAGKSIVFGPNECGYVVISTRRGTAGVVVRKVTPSVGEGRRRRVAVERMNLGNEGTFLPWMVICFVQFQTTARAGKPLRALLAFDLPYLSHWHLPQNKREADDRLVCTVQISVLHT